MSEFECIVIGEIGPQGSKSFRGMSKSGKAILSESSKKVKPWREAVKWAARAALRGMITGAVEVDMIFTLRKPKTAPKRRKTYPATRPDLDKCARSTCDALTQAGVIEDDSRIVSFGRLAKVYVGEDKDALDVPGAVIRVRRIE